MSKPSIDYNNPFRLTCPTCKEVMWEVRSMPSKVYQGVNTFHIICVNCRDYTVLGSGNDLVRDFSKIAN